MGWFNHQPGYNLLIHVVYWGYNPLILTFDPNFRPGTSKQLWGTKKPNNSQLNKLYEIIL